MDSVKLSQEQLEFQEYARRWLDENRPPPAPVRIPITALEVMTEPQRDYLRDWQSKCYHAGLVGADIDKKYGGGGHTGFQRLADTEMSRAGTPYMLNIIGLRMAIPTILVHGTEEQKLKFVAPALSADEIWCQGFSEPGAGSDLANQQTFAEPRGDEWVLNGHKVWTSLGHFAKWMILITRTSRDHKYDGLTYFISPIEDYPGVSVRPLIKMTGETGFNEILFQDVVVPDNYRLDDVGKGWTVAMTTLTYERGAAEGAGGGGGDEIPPIDQLIELARKSDRGGRPASEDSLIRDRIIQQAITDKAMRQNRRRARVSALCDHPMRIPLQGKLRDSEFMQTNARLGVDIAGASSTLYKLDPNAPDAGHWPLAYMNSYGQTIAAGTSEIQRNILGERVLGLAKSK
ncbi:MAG: acyl-CoA dehydrogenase [Deltaproteobacteria bacterium]|nr:acyl-CoA dehydrogenase [Deltaproteobacteria bacterium]